VTGIPEIKLHPSNNPKNQTQDLYVKEAATRTWAPVDSAPPSNHMQSRLNYARYQTFF